MVWVVEVSELVVLGELDAVDRCAWMDGDVDEQKNELAGGRWEVEDYVLAGTYLQSQRGLIVPEAARDQQKPRFRGLVIRNASAGTLPT